MSKAHRQPSPRISKFSTTCRLGHINGLANIVLTTSIRTILSQNPFSDNGVSQSFVHRLEVWTTRRKINTWMKWSHLSLTLRRKIDCREKWHLPILRLRNPAKTIERWWNAGSSYKEQQTHDEPTTLFDVERSEPTSDDIISWWSTEDDLTTSLGQTRQKLVLKTVIGVSMESQQSWCAPFDCDRNRRRSLEMVYHLFLKFSEDKLCIHILLNESTHISCSLSCGSRWMNYSTEWRCDKHHHEKFFSSSTSSLGM